ncbi:MAG TPA: LysM peptidoglycan-binding domain-containing protein [Tepidisphaeraceae bacterium]|jgi:nucleoid-associated protein YgaU|nr:LysM peptidoglycan-binding domain-containing protein [Tepidisphaeraceae bacterium]
MTRETKIGLLVGLAFIIVIGILLSDHLTTHGELPAAQLTQVGDNVRTASAVPVSANPPITPVTVPTNVTPNNTVLTHDELVSRPATAVVQVGPSRLPNSNGAQTAVSVNVGPATSASAVTDPLVTNTPSTVGQPLVALVATDPLMQPVTPGQTTPAVANNLKPHKAEKGDTVSRMALKFLGANTSTNRQAIIDANPSLKANPAKITVGHTYMIPSGKAGTDNTDASKTAVASTDTTATDKPKATVTTTTYTVKANDTLWKIAGGDSNLIKEIQDLNKDTLKGKSVVRAGLVLKIPAKTVVASR